MSGSSFALPAAPPGLSGHLAIKQHFSGGDFHETWLEAGASPSSGGDLCGAHPPTPQPAPTLQSLKATKCPSLGDRALLGSGWGRRASHRGAGAGGAAARHTRESMAYIWPVAVRPRGWGSRWGCQWLLGSARTEQGCVAASGGSRARGVPQRGDTAGEMYQDNWLLCGAPSGTRCKSWR